MTSKSSSQTEVLLFSDREDDVQFATAVAACAGVSLIVHESLAETVATIASKSPHAIFINIETETEYLEFENEIQQKIGLYSDRIKSNGIHFLSSASIEHIQYLIHSPLFGHYIYRNYQDPSRAGKHYAKILKATINERAFGLEGLLQPNARVQKIEITRSDQKVAAVDAVHNYAVSAGFKTRMAAVISNAVDELLMNAIFDAPVDSLGKHTLLSTSRSTVLELSGQSRVELSVGFDGEHIALQAIDLFGSLDKQKLLTHISKIYTNEEYRIKTSVAGAGIGLATVFRSGGSFFFSAEKGVRTEVTVFFEPFDSFAEFREQFRFISTQFYF